MKIAMIGQKGIPAHLGGVEQHVEAIAQHLVARGHEVVVYCRTSYCGREARSSSQGRLHRVVKPTIPTKHLDAVTHTLVSTADVMLRRADLVHYHAAGPAALSPLARLAGLPVVVTLHALDWRRAKWGRWARAALAAGERIAVHAARRVIVISPLLREYISRTYGRASELIPNGVTPMSRRDPQRMTAWGLEPRRFVLAVARLVPEKGLHTLIAAFCALGADLRLVIAGGSGLDADYERQLRALADERVVFTGPADRELLAELYSHARLFVLPSSLEGMSIALLEAMQMGLPVLVSDIPENTWLVQDAGLTHKAGDVEDLREALRSALGDPIRLAADGERAARRAAMFQWPALIDALENVYSSCRRP